MSSGVDHRWYAAAVAFAAAHARWQPEEHWSKHPLVAACIGAGCGTLPDLLEPATNPNHRQFFHSVAFTVVLGGVAYKVYHWQPETEGEQILRRVLLIAGCAYFVHLLADATTPKSLPLLGRV